MFYKVNDFRLVLDKPAVLSYNFFLCLSPKSPRKIKAYFTTQSRCICNWQPNMTIQSLVLVHPPNPACSTLLARTIENYELIII